MFGGTGILPVALFLLFWIVLKPHVLFDRPIAIDFVKISKV
ncbi:hypothetical protein [Microcoleus sp. bin38.metabat.b11b12b14.051]|nr:hypothetical protein [Microcoleus sp. bin38.metabat.b11b12b14.051]